MSAGGKSRVELTGRDGNSLRGDAAGPEDGVPVVLLHGGGQTRHSWANTLHVLADRGYRAYTLDQRGHGESDWPENGDYGLGAFADDIAAVARSFGQLPVLVGASLGGICSMIAISRSATPLARGLVLVDVGPRVEEGGSRRIQDFMGMGSEDGFGTLEEVADAVAAYNPHRPRPSDLSGLQRNLRKRADGRWIWHWDPRVMAGIRANFHEANVSVEGQARLDEAARSLRLPTLLVRGRQSDLLSQRGVDHFLALAPHAQFVDVAGAGHMIAGDRNDAFNEAVTQFITQLPRPS